MLVLVAAVLLAVWRINPPRADESSPAFARMMANIERLAADIRFVGTPNHAFVRDEIIAEIEAMGLTPILHRTTATLTDNVDARTRIFSMHNAEANASWLEWISDEDNRNLVIESNASYWASLFPGHPWGYGGHVYVDNILVTLPSTLPDAGSILFVAHYDTMQYTMGAADAMAPVAAMLEALRTHAQNYNLANTLHFLFIDAEEVAALGAFAFSRDFMHLINEVDMLINLEAVGNSGGLINFQTSENPHAMVRLYNRAVPRPMGFHWGDWVYATFMPGSYTDFTVFRYYGFSGLNFAILGGNEHYHTMSDNYENLNRNSAWHFFTTIMGLADYAANNSLAALSEPSRDAIFFPFLPGRMIVMTTITANILIGMTFALAITFIAYKFKAKPNKSLHITIILSVMLLVTVALLLFLSILSYLLWIPLLAVAISAFFIKRKWVYRSALVLSGAVALLLWTPPIYLLLLLFA